MKAYDTNSTPIVAKMNASGTARPISPAGATPLSAIAAVGAMIAIDSAIASQKCSSRRSPPLGAALVSAAPTDWLGLIGPSQQLKVIPGEGEKPTPLGRARRGRRPARSGRTTRALPADRAARRAD